jgi:hypothetical protein
MQSALYSPPESTHYVGSCGESVVRTHPLNLHTAARGFSRPSMHNPPTHIQATPFLRTESGLRERERRKAGKGSEKR